MIVLCSRSVLKKRWCQLMNKTPPNIATLHRWLERDHQKRTPSYRIQTFFFFNICHEILYLHTHPAPQNEQFLDLNALFCVEIQSRDFCGNLCTMNIVCVPDLRSSLNNQMANRLNR